MQPLVSVIVPVYNVEESLERCLDSLRRQSLVEMEVILVDDASLDQCGEICDTYSAKDHRFRVFHHEKNLGLSEARNTGIRKALCEYVMFVDSDDYVHVDFCKEAYQCTVDYQADLVLFCSQEVDKDGKLTSAVSFEYTKGSGYKTRFEAMALLQHGVGQAAWNKLYKKDLFNNISYPFGYLHEDIGTTYKLIWQASCIYYLDKILYFHCYRERSITSHITNKNKIDLIVMYQQQYHDLVVWGYPPKNLEKVLFNLAMIYCMRKKPNFSDPEYVFYADTLRHCLLSQTDFRWKKKVLLILFKYCPHLFELICTLHGKKITDRE